MRGRFFLACVATLFAAFSLAGCGFGGSDKPFTILIPVEAETLDPHFTTSTVEWTILMNVQEGLAARDTNMQPVPALAERWEVDPSRKAWTFHLRPGVKFQNGEPLDARAVKFTFERMQDEKLNAQIEVAKSIALERVEEVDTHTVRLHTRMPVAFLPAWLVNAFILPPKYYSSTPPREVLSKPVGTGPYKLTAWVKGDHIRMEANPGWWKGKPKIPAVVWRGVPIPTARAKELESGDADLITDITVDQAKALEGKVGGISVFKVQSGRRVYIGIRTDWGPFGDRRVRQAMNYAVNFDRITDKFLRGYGTRMASVVLYPNNNPNVERYPYDPAKAKALLAEASLKDTDGDGVLEYNGVPLRLKMDVPMDRYLQGENIAEAVTADLRAVGIHVEIQWLAWPAFLSSQRKKTLAPLYFHGLSSAFIEETDLGVVRPGLFANLTGWKNPAFTEDYRLLQQRWDVKGREKISYDLQALIREEAPWIFLWNQFEFFAGSARILWWTPRSDERIYIPDIQLKEAQTRN
ncbi:MAG: ABC transporter substrate-binding protein [Nitrospinota bacterium]|mgnify:CR=1 FL=1